VRLASIKPGDIIRASGMHAVVLDKVGRQLVVQGIGSGSMRRLRADEIEAHWRRVGFRAARVPPSPRREVVS
jgi:NMD protein affecting ribosome stability and mRNA decay